MNLTHYEYLVSDDFLTYEFCSEGPNGRINKIVQFTLVRLPRYSYFNLAFGDLDEDRKLNDFVTSNNHDAEKVLATVARAVILFTDKYPDALVFAEGSTISRTRRYQMGINKYWKEIEALFLVYGFVENFGFEAFRSGVNYKAFAVKRKKS